MSNQDGMLLQELLEEIDKHPPDDPRRVMLNAFREIEAEKLKGWTVEGTDDDQPKEFLQIATVGLLNASLPPAYFVLPGSTEDDDREHLIVLVGILAKERPRKTSFKELNFLVGDAVTTLAHAVYARKADGSTIIELWHHPQLSYRQGVWIAMNGIASESANLTKSS